MTRSMGQVGNDTIFGGDGTDSLSGGNDDDVVSGDSGNDTLEGGFGNDSLLGGSGNDVLADDFQSGINTFTGIDTLLGQAGNDTLLGYGGPDSMDGGAGNDLEQTFPVNLPTITAADVVSAAEGNAGTITVTFLVTLSRAATGFERVDYTTADGTAVAAVDYVATSNTLAFAAGQISLPVTVTINGDTRIEGNEFFFLNFSNPQFAQLGVSRASAVITDDDPLRLYASITGVSAISQIDPQTGATLGTFPTPVPSSGGPDGLAYDGNSVFYLANAPGNQRVFELDPNTGAVRAIHPFASASNLLDGIATLNGNVYIMDSQNSDILVLNLTTNMITATLDINGVNGGTTIRGGIGAVSGGGGPDRLVATSFNSTGNVEEINPVTGQITNTFLPNTGRGPLYRGVAGLNGELYFGSTTGLVDVFTREIGRAHV